MFFGIQNGTANNYNTDCMSEISFEDLSLIKNCLPAK